MRSGTSTPERDADMNDTKTVHRDTHITVSQGGRRAITHQRDAVIRLVERDGWSAATTQEAVLTLLQVWDTLFQWSSGGYLNVAADGPSEDPATVSLHCSDDHISFGLVGHRAGSTTDGVADPLAVSWSFRPPV